MEHKANVNQCTRLNTPLMIAARYGDSKLINLLIAHNADPNMILYCHHALDFAVNSKNLSTTLALINKKALSNVTLPYEAIVSTAQELSKNFTNKQIGQYLDIAKALVEHEEYDFNHTGDLKYAGDYINYGTILNAIMTCLYECKRFFSCMYTDPIGLYTQELTSQVLILIANSPNLTDNLVTQTATFSSIVDKRYLTNYTNATVITRTILGTFTPEFFQEHPYWSIYRSAALKAQLAPEARRLSDENGQRSIELKVGIDETLKPHIPVNDVADLVLVYAFVPDVDFAAANFYQ